MAATNFPFYMVQLFTDAGAAAANHLLYTYASGTTTPLSTWTDKAQTTLNANPIVLDSSGRCTMFGGPSEYTLVLKTPGGATVWTRDNVAALPIAATTPYVPIAGDVDMTGQFRLSGNATENLNPVPLQQVELLITASTPAAASVAIADAGSYYTGTNVEAALQEVPVLPGRLLAIQVFTSSGTWTKNALCTTAWVDVQAGGGGSFTASAGGGGGGEGGRSMRRVTTPGATETVTVGAGGAVNTAGGSSSFGSFATANGGAAGAATGGGLGGTASSGDLNQQGAGGGYGGAWSANNYFGHGGGRGGAPGDLNRSSGMNGGTNTGGGGSGGSSTGGTGGSGYVIVYSYT